MQFLRSRTSWLSLLSAALVLALCGNAWGRPISPTASRHTPPSTETTALAKPRGPDAEDASVLPLARLVGDENPLRITGVQGDLHVNLPIPANQQPSQVALELVGTTSNALMQTSQLIVEVNGQAVQQIRLGEQQGRLNTVVPIPPHLLRPSSNDVRLAFIHHYTDKCEDPGAPQLWSQLDTRASRFVGRFTDAQPPVRLDKLDTLFDKWLWERQPVVPILSSGPSSADVTAAMGLVAQGIGKRFDYVPVKITHSMLPPDASALPSALPANARGAVAMGTFAELQGLLAGTDAPREGAPVIVLRALPGSPKKFLLLFAAQTRQELRNAAGVFALARFPWPASSWMAIPALRLPLPEGMAAAEEASNPSSKAYPLSALGYRTLTSSGMSAQPARIQVWNPAWQGRAQIRVHANYAAGMSARSALNIMINGLLQGSIPLNNIAGGEYTNYAVTIPAGVLKPGWNTLEIQPMLVPAELGGECKPLLPGNLSVTIHDDTTFQTIGGSPLNQPELSLLAKEGRLIPGASPGDGMVIQLTDDGHATLGAGLSLMAKLSQISKAPLLHTQLQVGNPTHARSTLWVGSLEKLPKDVREAIGLRADGTVSSLVPVMQSISVDVLESGRNLQALKEDATGPHAQPTVLRAQADWKYPAARGGLAAVTLLGDRSIAVFTAASPDFLEDAMAALIDHGAWSQLKGQFAMWTPDEGSTMRTISADEAPFVSYSLRGALGLWISQYRWGALAILVAGIGILVWLTRRVLGYYHSQRLAKISSTR